MSRHVEGEGGNREVSPPSLFDDRGDASGASVEAFNPKEGGSRGKHGFLRASEPKASEVAA